MSPQTHTLALANAAFTVANSERLAIDEHTCTLRVKKEDLSVLENLLRQFDRTHRGLAGLCERATSLHGRPQYESKGFYVVPGTPPIRVYGYREALHARRTAIVITTMSFLCVDLTSQEDLINDLTTSMSAYQVVCRLAKERNL